MIEEIIITFFFIGATPLFLLLLYSTIDLRSPIIEK